MCLQGDVPNLLLGQKDVTVLMEQGWWGLDPPVAPVSAGKSASKPAKHS